MNDLADVLGDLVRIFERMSVPYAVMGGIAVRVYGIPRPTYDVDFTISVDRQRLTELFTSAESQGYTVPPEYAAGWVDHVAGMPVVKVGIYVGEKGVDVDIFLAESEFQESILARRRRADFDGLSAWFVSPEDLILLKLLAHRPKDLADIGDVLFIQGQLDEAYMRSWADQLGIRSELEQVLAGESQG